jgi:hypothetical protein
MKKYDCSICSRADRDQIDAALRARTPLRSISKTFGGGSDIRTGLKNHAVGCITGLGRGARANAKGGRPRRAGLPTIGDDFITPSILSANDVITELTWAYGETKRLYEIARAGSDTRLMDKALAQSGTFLEKFSKIHRLYDDGTTVEVDAKIANVLASLSEDGLRGLLEISK